MIPTKTPRRKVAMIGISNLHVHTSKLEFGKLELPNYEQPFPFLLQNLTSLQICFLLLFTLARLSLFCNEARRVLTYGNLLLGLGVLVYALFIRYESTYPCFPR